MGSIFTTETQSENYPENSSESSVGNLNDNMLSDSPNNNLKQINGLMNSTDAVQSNIYFPTTSVITPEQVESFEKDLEFYEKVSLVFLLYENADIALQGLLTEEYCHNNGDQKSNNLISKWARTKHVTSWQNQLLEALCILQNFSIIKKLGYDKNDLNLRYLPSNASASLNINKTRKMLLKVCDYCNKQTTQQFISLLKADFEKECINFQHFNEAYLEMYFLNCFSRHYIENDDLSNLIKIFKQMDLDIVCDMLKGVNRPTEGVKNDSKKKVTENIKNENICKEDFQKSCNKNLPNCSPSGDIKVKFNLNEEAEDQNYVHENKVFAGNSTSMPSSRSNYRSDELYYIDPKNPGICLIINQRNFYKETDPKQQISLLTVYGNTLLDRLGTDVDRDKLQETFEKLGFKVIITENLTHLEIDHEIRRVMKIFSKRDSCLIVCILSHGYENNIFGVNSISVEIQTIEDILHDTAYPNVLQKPKILIMQSCQGEPLQDVILHNGQYNTVDGPKKMETRHNFVCREVNNVTAGPTLIPRRSDLLVCSSTIPGYASIRNEKEGSWYIQELCKVIMEEGDRKHFVDILFNVNDNVCRRSWYIKDERKTVCMVPGLRTSFRKRLFLPVPETGFS